MLEEISGEGGRDDVTLPSVCCPAGGCVIYDSCSRQERLWKVPLVLHHPHGFLFKHNI